MNPRELSGDGGIGIRIAAEAHNLLHGLFEPDGAEPAGSENGQGHRLDDPSRDPESCADFFYGRSVGKSEQRRDTVTNGCVGKPAEDSLRKEVRIRVIGREVLAG